MPTNTNYDQSQRTFDIEKCKFSLWAEDYEEQNIDGIESLNEQLFTAAMEEMISYLFERRLQNKEESGNLESLDLLFHPDNVENIYINARGLAAPNVIVEYKNVPEWFTMKNAELREFTWRPRPAHAPEWTAAYFQPRRF